MLSSLTSTNALIKWTMIFNRDENEHNILVFDDLKETCLENAIVWNSTEDYAECRYFFAEEYNTTTDHLNILPHMKLENSEGSVGPSNSMLLSAEISRIHKFYTVHIPLTKSAYLKLKNLSLDIDAKFEDADIYNILKYLLLRWNDTQLLTYKLCKHLSTDTALYSRLEDMHHNDQTTNRNTGLMRESSENMGMFSLLADNIKKHIYFQLFDGDKNIAIAAGNKEKTNKLSLTVALGDFNQKLVIHYLAMDYIFLVDNQAKLLQVFSNYDQKSLTVEIDFSNFFYNFFYVHEDECSFGEYFSVNFSQVLCCELISSPIVSQLILRLRNLTLAFNFDLLITDKIIMYTDRCVIEGSFMLPPTTRELHVSHSRIGTDIKLPARLEKVNLNVLQIESGHSIVINNECRSVVIRDVKGQVVLLCLEINTNLASNSLWTEFELHRNNEGVVKELKVINARFTDDLELNEGLTKLYLEKVVLQDGARLKLNRGCRDITIEQCVGYFDMSNIAEISQFCSTDKIIQFKWLSNESNHELALSDANFDQSVTLDNILRKIYLCNVKFKPNTFLGISAECISFAAKNFEGTINFVGTCGLGIVDFSLLPDLTPNRMYGTRGTLAFNRANHKITMNYLKLHQSVRLNPCIKDITMRSVEVAHGRYVSIENGFDHIELFNCKGDFIIPGLEPRRISLNANNCLVSMTRKESNLYYVSIRRMELTSPLCFDVNIGFLSITGVDGASLRLNGACNHLTMDNSSSEIEHPNTAVFNKLSLYNYTSVPRHLLPIPSNELVLENVIIHCSYMVSSSVKNVDFRAVSVENGCVLSLGLISGEIKMSECFGSFDVPNYTNLDYYNYLVFSDASIVELGLHLGKSFLELVVHHLTIDHDVDLKDIIKSVSLFNVRIEEDCVLRIGKECEQLTVEDCDGEIDTSQAEHIRFLTLKDTPFIYDRLVHKRVESLSLRHMVLEQTIILGNSIRTLDVSNTIVRRRSVFHINSECENLRIKHFDGILHTSQIANLQVLRLNNETSIEIDHSEDGGSILISNLGLSNDTTLKDNVRAVKLSGFKTINNHVLKIGKHCEVLELDGCRANIAVPTPNSLRTVILRDANHYHLIKCLNTPSPSELKLYNIKIPIDLSLPNNFKAVTLSSITMRENETFKISDEREELCLEHCMGSFDLSEVANLKRLVLYPCADGYFDVYFPDLIPLNELAVAYNFNAVDIEYLLSNSSNITSLSICSFSGLESTKRMESFVDEIGQIIESFKSQSVYKQLTDEYYRSGRLFNAGDLINIVNLRMNAFVRICLHFRSCSTLEYLSLVGFALDNENTKQLKNCTSLKTLVIEVHFIHEGMLRSLPDNLETLEIIGARTFSFYDRSISAVQEKNIKFLREHGTLKTLIVPSAFFLFNNQNFYHLPVNLKCLTIGYFNVPEEIDRKHTSAKIVLKQLIIVDASPAANQFIFSNSYLAVRYYEDMLNYAALFIDFTKLDTLGLKVGGSMLSVDPLSFAIK